MPGRFVLPGVRWIPAVRHYRPKRRVLFGRSTRRFRVPIFAVSAFASGLAATWIIDQGQMVVPTPARQVAPVQPAGAPFGEPPTPATPTKPQLESTTPPSESGSSSEVTGPGRPLALPPAIGSPKPQPPFTAAPFELPPIPSPPPPIDSTLAPAETVSPGEPSAPKAPKPPPPETIAPQAPEPPAPDVVAPSQPIDRTLAPETVPPPEPMAPPATKPSPSDLVSPARPAPPAVREPPHRQAAPTARGGMGEKAGTHRNSASVRPPAPTKSQAIRHAKKQGKAVTPVVVAPPAHHKFVLPPALKPSVSAAPTGSPILQVGVIPQAGEE